MEFLKLNEKYKPGCGKGLVQEHPGILDKLSVLSKMRTGEELKEGDCIKSMSSVFAINSPDSLALVISESGPKVIFRFLEFIDRIYAGTMKQGETDVEVSETEPENAEQQEGEFRVKKLEFDLLRGSDKGILEFKIVSSSYPADITFTLLEKSQVIKYDSCFLDDEILDTVIPEVLAWRFKNDKEEECSD